MSFVHGTYFADSIMVARQELKARGVFQENIAVFLNVRKCGGGDGGTGSLQNKYRGVASRPCLFVAAPF